MPTAPKQIADICNARTHLQTAMRRAQVQTRVQLLVFTVWGDAFDLEMGPRLALLADVATAHIEAGVAVPDWTSVLSIVRVYTNGR